MLSIVKLKMFSGVLIMTRVKMIMRQLERNSERIALLFDEGKICKALMILATAPNLFLQLVAHQWKRLKDLERKMH